MSAIKQSSLDFLKMLSENNNREWFNAHKDLYTEAHNNIIAFADALLGEMRTHDQIETPSGRASLYRIYRDVRFSKDKTPYSTNWNGGFKRATKKLRGGYYFNIEPGNTYIVGGFWNPSTDDMRRLRQDMAANQDEWNEVLAHPVIVSTFGKLQGSQLRTAPRGYEKDHPAIALLRYKQFLMYHHFPDENILRPGFAKEMSDAFRQLRPFFDFMSEVLTTDANGEDTV